MQPGEAPPAAFLRALAGLRDGSGRTVVLAGPALSGKSALLGWLRVALRAEGCAVLDLQGVYRDRTSAYGLVAPLAGGEGATPSLAQEASTEAGPDEDDSGDRGFGEPAPDGGRSRRARGSRQRGTVMGVPYAVRTRGVAEVDPAEYWRGLVARFDDGSLRGQAILIEEGIYADPESRDVLLYLVERARLRPLLIVLALDTGEAGFSAWEEKLLGRTDIDWIRLSRSREDPRDAARLRRAWETLRPATRRAVTLLALLGGTASEVALCRVARRSFQEMAGDLLPAIEAKVLRAEDGRVTLKSPEWAQVLPSLWPEAELRSLHREVAEALEALHREATLERRRELAAHYFAWEPGATALRYLLEAAELAERLTDHDAVTDLTGHALACLPGLPSADRPAAEVELGLFHARGLLLSGRAEDGQEHVVDAVHHGLDQRLPKEFLEEWLEPTITPLIVVGPRSSLDTALSELADRCEQAGNPAAAALLASVVVTHEVERGRFDRARHQARRVGHLARRLERGPAQALAMMAVGLAYLSWAPVERALAERFLDAAHQRFVASRRPDLQQLTEELRVRLLQLSGHTELAFQARVQAIPILQRLRLPAVEVLHQLGVAEMLLATRPDARAQRALRRAGDLVDQLHLTPPSPSLLRFWLLQGRHLEALPDLTAARDWYSAVAEQDPSVCPAAIVREGRLRLARLELADHRVEAAARWFARVPLSGAEGRRAPEPGTASGLDQRNDGNQPGSSA